MVLATPAHYRRSCSWASCMLTPAKARVGIGANLSAPGPGWGAGGAVAWAFF